VSTDSVHRPHGPAPLLWLRRQAERLQSRFRNSPSRSASAGDGNPSPQKRKLYKRLLIILLVLLVYPVTGTVLLSTGVLEKMVGSEDLKVRIQTPAWTLWPGHFHVAGALVLVNGDTQFKLEAKNLLIHLQLFPLIKRHLRVTKLSAKDVHYFMRVQVKDTKGIEKRVAAYPKLDDLPGNPTVVEKKADKSEPRESDFTVDVEGIHVDVSELWFMEYHYVGPGTLTGSFLVGPHRMRVGTSVQQLGPGELRFGATEPLMANFHGRIQAEIPDVNPEQHADESFLELVTARIELAGNVVKLDPMSAYTGKMRIIDGAGLFDSTLVLAKGRLSDGVHITYTTKKVGVRSQGFGVDTDFDFDARVAKGQAHDLPEVRAKAGATYVSKSNTKGAIFTVQLLDHEHDVVLNSTQLGRMTDINHARIRFPNIVTNDLHDLSAFSEEPGAVSSRSGEAYGSLFLDVDDHHVAKGQMKARLDGVSFGVEGVQVSAQGALDSSLWADLDHEIFSVQNLTFSLTEVGMRAGKETVEKWWTTAEIPEFVARGLPPERMEGRFSLRAKNAEPLLKTLAAKDEISSLIPKLTSLSDLRVRARFRKDHDVTDVSLVPVENNLFDVAGRYYAKKDDSRMAIVVGGKVISLGIATSKKSGTTLMPFAREGWLNEQLRTFPAPVEQVKSSQP
jgi:hypothetical protein